MNNFFPRNEYQNVLVFCLIKYGWTSVTFRRQNKALKFMSRHSNKKLYNTIRVFEKYNHHKFYLQINILD